MPCILRRGQAEGRHAQVFQADGCGHQGLLRAPGRGRKGIDVKARMLDRGSMVFSAIATTIASLLMMLAAAPLFAQQGQDWPGERIPLSAVAWALSCMGVAVLGEAGAIWWLIKQFLKAQDATRKREECLTAEAREAEARYAQEISDTIREVMPLTIKLTDYIPVQQKLTQALMDLASALSWQQEREAKRP